MVDKIYIAGQEVRIKRKKKMLDPGACWPSLGKIKVRTEDSKDFNRDTEWHEVLHCILELWRIWYEVTCHIPRRKKESKKAYQKRKDHLQETVVGILAPATLDALRQLGWLKDAKD